MVQRAPEHVSIARSMRVLKKSKKASLHFGVSCVKKRRKMKKSKMNKTVKTYHSAHGPGAWVIRFAEKRIERKPELTCSRLVLTSLLASRCSGQAPSAVQVCWVPMSLNRCSREAVRLLSLSGSSSTTRIFSRCQTSYPSRILIHRGMSSVHNEGHQNVWCCAAISTNSC
jgi:hypothetical protein